MDKLDKKLIINELIKYYSGGNKAEFARKLGISPQGLSTWLTRNTFDIELIYSKCEDVSAEWLLTGTGEMLRSEREKPVVNSDEILQLRTENNLFRELLKDKETQISGLNMEVGKLRERVSSFSGEHGESTSSVGLSGGGSGLPMPVDAPVIPSVPEVSTPATIPTEKLKQTPRTRKPNP